MDNAMLTAGICFVVFCIIIMPLSIITLSLTSAIRGDMGQCIGDGTHTIVGNADLAVLHSAVAIISKLIIGIGGKIANHM